MYSFKSSPHQNIYLELEISRTLNKRVNLLDVYKNKIKRNGYPYFENLLGHYSCVNAVSFSRYSGSMICSGSDDTRVLLWSTFQRKLIKSLHGHTSNIFSTIFDFDNTHIFSSSSDNKILRYDIEASKNTTSNSTNRDDSCDSYCSHRGFVFKVCLSPTNRNLMASSGDDGYLLIWDLRTKKPIDTLRSLYAFTSVDFHPSLENRLISTNSECGLQEWDIRYLGKDKPLINYNTMGFKSVCGASYSQNGKYIGASVVGSYPMLFEIESPTPLIVFYNNNYRNSCTLKSITFGLNDESIISGSDDFGVYIWNIPRDLESTLYRNIPNQLTEQSQPSYIRNTMSKLITKEEVSFKESADHVLVGHRSIVNNIASHPKIPLLCSTGVEKILKLWSPYPITPEHTLSPPIPQLRQPISEINLRTFNFAQQLNYTADDTEESLETLLLFDWFNVLEEENVSEEEEEDEELSSSDSLNFD